MNLRDRVCVCPLPRPFRLFSETSVACAICTRYLDEAAIGRLSKEAALERLRKAGLMPVTKENLRATMSYHGLDEKQKAAYDRIEAAAIAFADVVLDVLPASGDQQAAIRHIFEAKATANRGVATRGIV